MFGKNRKAIIALLKSNIDECKNSMIMARKEGYTEDSHIMLQFSDRVDHCVTIAHKMLDANLIKHEDYKTIYQYHMDFITWHRESRSWVDNVLDEIKGAEMRQRYEEHQRAQAEGFSRLLGALFGMESLMIQDEGDDDEDER